MRTPATPVAPAHVSTAGEIKALTGLRAVVATWVVLFHFSEQLGPYLGALPFFAPIVQAGWTGVELFFVLSGFVITRAYVDRLGARPRPRAVVRFFANRWARVWPAWAVVTVFMAGWLWCTRRAGWAEVVSEHPATDLQTLLGQLTLAQLWGRDGLQGTSYVVPGWSISAEWAAYLAFPLLAVLIRPLRGLPAVVLVGLAVAAMAPLAVNSYLYGPADWDQPWRLRIACGFLAGALTALAVEKVRRSAQWEAVAHRGLWVCSALLVLGAHWAGWRLTMPGAGGDHSGVVVVLFPLVVGALALTVRGPARMLAGRSLVYGGRISYALYLVHYVVLEVVLSVVRQDPDMRGILPPGLALAAPLMIVGCFAIAALIYHGVESPARDLIVQLLDRVLPSSPGGSVIGSRRPGTGRSGRPAGPAGMPAPRAGDERRTPVHPRSTEHAMALAAHASVRTEARAARATVGPTP